MIADAVIPLLLEYGRDITTKQIAELRRPRRTLQHHDRGTVRILRWAPDRRGQGHPLIRLLAFAISFAPFSESAPFITDELTDVVLDGILAHDRGSR